MATTNSTPVVIPIKEEVENSNPFVAKLDKKLKALKKKATTNHENRRRFTSW